METPKTKDRFICVAKIIGAHGIKGEVKIKPFTESLETFEAFEEFYDSKGQFPCRVKVRGEVKGALIASIAGVMDRNKAESLSGRELYVSRDALPETEENEFYYEDLMGLAVVTEEGKALGTVKALHNFGAGDIIEIALLANPKDTTLLPFNHETVPEIDLNVGKVVVCLPDIIVAKEE
ncbi:MAG: ribosome maturation factor RimM [Rickettsiales bacterium]|jgi:16S rRNA processing protein RimM|nr:ribosome maturation factor RimM [Rickettsiales bacterium]